MKLDRLMIKTVTRLAKGGVAGLRQTAGSKADAADETKPEKKKDDDLRGSGSWANEWSGARNALSRAKSRALPGKQKEVSRVVTTKPRVQSRVLPNADPVPEGSVHVKPLMTPIQAKLYNWIADRIEAEAPDCTLHAGVAVQAFLTSDIAHEFHDPLSNLIADYVVADGHGRPLMALLRDNKVTPTRHLIMIDALLDANVPIVDIPERPSAKGLWADISRHLPKH
ncbi:hypothetical protein [Jannaschia pohangensis]|uniref:Uncharacterized protein n=1 Tax=Jannaschia pohangensis TaxID=390807 RepID=A0A1I3JLN5_9RHOB|nr:hypothetical protein [Jannaschia pohangensis]SFI61153.1 hypothetical protein SAMN04488095_1361 [Jannaschia pohangensis]